MKRLAARARAPISNRNDIFRVYSLNAQRITHTKLAAQSAHFQPVATVKIMILHMVGPVPENRYKAIAHGKPAEYAQIDGLQLPNGISFVPDCPELSAMNKRLPGDECIKEKIKLFDRGEDGAKRRWFVPGDALAQPFRKARRREEQPLGQLPSTKLNLNFNDCFGCYETVKRSHTCQLIHYNVASRSPGLLEGIMNCRTFGLYLFAFPMA
ncbi:MULTISPECIES: hypothetical protein [unclassified Rhizobium]|uniref:hypothetical protein n=1 Tax=unclassified Rhizobium TaxID=2613769 RepID=UPI0013AF95FF|nr:MULTISPECIES: hypothetical protein [unclassified Rhizobium]MBB3287021.1 hypothetical protein [Rhizobium sp. BK252]MBB3414295.1 hypothetical protein [Rhizobium sp. BK284]MBB3482182.1 hypothetical protein [Rhizobium sp. BK347]MDK4718516.1 hypothetical protein [Rhizobium sp. CNPSo 3968]